MADAVTEGRQKGAPGDPPSLGRKRAPPLPRPQLSMAGLQVDFERFKELARLLVVEEDLPGRRTLDAPNLRALLRLRLLA